MPDTQRRLLVEQCCIVMHNAYEVAATKTGWETQERSRKTWDEVPESNKETMRIAVGVLVDFLSERLMHHTHKQVEKMPDAQER
jgi:hypothetical protein